MLNYAKPCLGPSAGDLDACGVGAETLQVLALQRVKPRRGRSKVCTGGSIAEIPAGVKRHVCPLKWTLPSIHSFKYLTCNIYKKYIIKKIGDIRWGGGRYFLGGVASREVRKVAFTPANIESICGFDPLPVCWDALRAALDVVSPPLVTAGSHWDEAPLRTFFFSGRCIFLDFRFAS